MLRAAFARCPGELSVPRPRRSSRLRCRRERGGSRGAPGGAALPQLLQLAHKLSAGGRGAGGKDGTAPQQQRAASRCRYLLMKPSPSPSQVWKSRLILSSSPVLEVSVLLLPALLTSATAAAAIMRPAPEEAEEVGKEEEEEARLPREPGIPSPAAPAKCERQHKAGWGPCRPRTHRPRRETRAGIPPGLGAGTGQMRLGAPRPRTASSCFLPPLPGAGITAGPTGSERAVPPARSQPPSLPGDASGRRVRAPPNPPRGSLVPLGLGRAGSRLRRCCFGCGFGRSAEAKRRQTNKPQRFL